MGPHSPVIKRALASEGDAGCGFFKEVNRQSPEADPNLHLVHRLRTRVRGIVPKPPTTLDRLVFSKHKENFTLTFCTAVTKYKIQWKDSGYVI